MITRTKYRLKKCINYLTDEKLHKIYDLIRKEVNPYKIILFGSRVREENSEDSDYDILIITNDVQNEREITRKVNFSLLNNNINVPVDLIVTTENNLCNRSSR